MRYERKEMMAKGKKGAEQIKRGAFFNILSTFLRKNQGTIFSPRDVRVTLRVDDEP